MPMPMTMHSWIINTRQYVHSRVHFRHADAFFRVLDDNKNIYTQEREIEREKEREEEEGRYVADTI